MEKYFFVYIVGTLLALCGLRSQAQTYQQWMSNFDDCTPLSLMSIPGSHDSGTTTGPELLVTQTKSIEEQLQLGVRFFDIRLAAHNNKLGVFHAIAFQNIYWESDVLPTFINFLKENPSETLIVSLKREGGEASDYARLLSASLSDALNKQYLIDSFTSDITLGEARGKIIFMHRDHAMHDFQGVECSDWADDATCKMTLTNRHGDKTRVLLEDEYQHNSITQGKKKNKAVINNLKRAAKNQDATTWAITFASATGYPTITPKQFADIVNPAVAQHVSKNAAKHFGIIVLDFIGDNATMQIIKSIANKNMKD
jgi:1-phosphatidylinositol phosphodiesterase